MRPRGPMVILGRRCVVHRGCMGAGVYFPVMLGLWGCVACFTWFRVGVGVCGCVKSFLVAARHGGTCSDRFCRFWFLVRDRLVFCFLVFLLGFTVFSGLGGVRGMGFRVGVAGWFWFW